MSKKFQGHTSVTQDKLVKLTCKKVVLKSLDITVDVFKDIVIHVLTGIQKTFQIVFHHESLQKFNITSTVTELKMELTFKTEAAACAICSYTS